MGYVFISYSRQDAAVVERIRQTLDESGYSCWVDRKVESIAGGKHWRRAIVDAIEDAEIFLLVLSLQSVESQSVLRELDIATDAGIPIIPVEIQPASLPKTMKFQLAGLQRVDLTANWHDGFERLLFAMRNSEKAKKNFRLETPLDFETKMKELALAILKEPTLSIAEKTAKIQTAYAAEAKKIREKKSRIADQRQARMATLLKKMADMRQRRHDLQNELTALKKKGAEESRTIRLVEEKIDEIDRMHNLLATERRALDLEQQKWLKDEIAKIRRFGEKMEAESQTIREDANKLIGKIFEDKK